MRATRGRPGAHRETEVQIGQVETGSYDGRKDEPLSEVVHPCEVKRHLLAVVVADLLHGVERVPEGSTENLDLGGVVQGREQFEETQLAEREEQRGFLFVNWFAEVLSVRFVSLSLRNQLTSFEVYQHLVERKLCYVRLLTGQEKVFRFDVLEVVSHVYIEWFRIFHTLSLFPVFHVRFKLELRSVKTHRDQPGIFLHFDIKVMVQSTRDVLYELFPDLTLRERE
eukprot:1176092-Prorocentrum_minimum.AAC.8